MNTCTYTQIYRHTEQGRWMMSICHVPTTCHRSRQGNLSYLWATSDEYIYIYAYSSDSINGALEMIGRTKPMSCTHYSFHSEFLSFFFAGVSEQIYIAVLAHIVCIVVVAVDSTDRKLKRFHTTTMTYYITHHSLRNSSHFVHIYFMRRAYHHRSVA